MAKKKFLDEIYRDNFKMCLIGHGTPGWGFIRSNLISNVDPSV
jgi:hypothetical protein